MRQRETERARSPILFGASKRLVQGHAIGLNLKINQLPVEYVVTICEFTLQYPPRHFSRS